MMQPKSSTPTKPDPTILTTVTPATLLTVIRTHLLISIVWIQCIGLKHGNVPYFPIEISRTAASCAMTKSIFLLTAVTLGGTLLQLRAFDNDLDMFGMWVGLFIVAMYPDDESWGAHMFGLAVLVFGFVVKAYKCQNRRHALKIVVSALALYLLRIVLKVAVVWWYCAPTGVMDIAHVSLGIMFKGASACLATENAPLLIPVFQMGGLMQFVVFYLLSMVLEVDSGKNGGVGVGEIKTKDV